MGRADNAKDALKFAGRAFTQIRKSLAGRKVPRPVSRFVAYGSRGSFQSITRSAAKSKIKDFVGNYAQRLDNPFHESLIMEFVDVIADVNLRAIQQYYNSHEDEFDDDWIKTNFSALGNAYTQAIANWGRSKIYDLLVDGYMAKHGVPEKAQTIIKEFGFATLEAAVVEVQDLAKRWHDAGGPES